VVPPDFPIVFDRTERRLIGIKERPDAPFQIGRTTRSDIMDRERIHITQHTPLGAAWFAGWLFTIGYLQLNFWSGLLGLIVWPYFLGSHFVPQG
jgi:hypothetical protein